VLLPRRAVRRGERCVSLLALGTVDSQMLTQTDTEGEFRPLSENVPSARASTADYRGALVKLLRGCAANASAMSEACKLLSDESAAAESETRLAQQNADTLRAENVDLAERLRIAEEMLASPARDVEVPGIREDAPIDLFNQTSLGPNAARGRTMAGTLDPFPDSVPSGLTLKGTVSTSTAQIDGGSRRGIAQANTPYHQRPLRRGETSRRPARTVPGLDDSQSSESSL
jgi:hypothetical protein